jgi:hypothetical protein
MEKRMTDGIVKQICQEWIEAGAGDDCFWENWPACPSDIALTPKMVLTHIEALEAELVQLQDAKDAVTLTPNPVDDSPEPDPVVKPAPDYT